MGLKKIPAAALLCCVPRTGRDHMPQDVVLVYCSVLMRHKEKQGRKEGGGAIISYLAIGLRFQMLKKSSGPSLAISK